ncbi:hypothetical protein QPK31_17420 [Massilia sp. YIM B02769]|uniref:hypothetical protein n=1 Tax=Massilia sp. YIM B02769 TaxID=3050129 RepID=UPI0025B64253|nr:hypothetical protein [Massilia sp. YIM B02769]MDN4059991.1 hypothetical protein [Massilia sp. YIM B02769]
MIEAKHLAGLAVAVAVAASASAQQGFTAGTYMLEGGSYSIDVSGSGNTLVVKEPNKQSVYTQAAPGMYHFTNPNNGITYSLRIVDALTLEAGKVPANGAPSRLVLVGGAAPAQVDEGESERFREIAMNYQQRSISDPDNVQLWTACAGAAFKASASTRADHLAYASQMAQMLKQIMVNTAESPCPDAIPASAW